MSASKLGSWFITESGKRFCFYLTGTVTTGVLLTHYLPHTIFLDQYKDILHLYKNGMSVPLSSKLQERFQRALDLVEVDPIDKHLFVPFSYCGFDVMSAGSSYSRFGVIVGLPFNFPYENVEMVDKSKIKLNQESIIWDSEDGQKLMESLVIPENAQLYAMAREIKFRQTPKPLLDTVFATTSCILAYSLGNHINTKFDFYSKPRSLRFILYSFIGVFVGGLYAMSKDMLQLYYEEKIDKELKLKHKLFAEGGREYYSKILDRNQALRQLLGREGEKLYTVLGNENFLFRNRHLPIVHRKSLFDEPLAT